jgi:hypothetical protein
MARNHGPSRGPARAFVALLIALLAVVIVLDPFGSEAQEPGAPIDRTDPGSLASTDLPPLEASDADGLTSSVPSPNEGAPESPSTSEDEDRTSLGASLHVRVSTPAGAPVSGVPLWLMEATRPQALNEAPMLVTDDEGRVRFPSVSPGLLVVLGRPGISGEIQVAVNASPTLELVMDDPGRTVLGRVVSKDGGPIAGAQVWCSQFPSSHEIGREVAVTDGGGGFRVSFVTDQHLLAADAEGYVPAYKIPLEHLPTSPTGEVAIVLEPGGFSLDVLVTDTAGAPLPGVRLRALDSTYGSHTGAASFDGVTDRMARPVLTDAQGRATLTGLPDSITVDARSPGRVVAERYLVFTPDGTPQTFRYEDSMGPLSGDPLVLELTMHEEALVVGRVTDTTGAPVALAFVSCDHVPDDTSRQAWSGDDGRFVLRGLPSYGETQVPFTVVHSQYTDLAESIVLTAAGSTEWNPVLSRGGVVSGTVVDGFGQPFEGAYFIAHGDAWTGQAQADTEGRFTFGGIDDAQIMIQAWESLDHLTSWSSLDRTVDVPTEGLELVLPRGLVSGRVIGRIVDGEGQPLASKLALVGVPEDSSLYGSRALMAVTDESDGAFVIDKVKSGEFELRVEVLGRPEHVVAFTYPDVSVDHELGTIEVPAGGTVLLTPRMASDPTSEELITFALYHPHGPRESTLTVRVGRTATSVHPAGEYLLSVADKETASQLRTITLQDGDRLELAVDVERGLTLWMHGQKPDEPFDEPRVIRVRERGGELVRQIQWTGKGTIRQPVGLAPGPYEVWVGPNGPWIPFDATVQQQTVWLDP